MKRNGKLISRKYLEFFIPTVLTAMATNFAAIVDAGIVGNLMDSAALSVINILLPVVQVYAAVAVLFGIAGSVIIASSRGRDASDTETGNRAFTVICASLAAISLVLMAVQFACMDGIVALLTPVEELRPLVKEYYVPFIAGTPVNLLMSGLVHVIRTDNRPKYATAITLTANGVNLILDIVFIRCFGLGLTGASLATEIGAAAGLIMVGCHFRSGACTVRWEASVLKRRGGFFRSFRAVFTSGLPGAVGMLLTTAKLLFLNLLIQHYGGKAGMVAFSAVSLCQILESAFVTGGCQAMVPIVSLLYGERDHGGIRTVFRKAARILVLSSLLITAVMELFPGAAAGIYGIGGAELAPTVRAIRISALMLPGDALVFLFIYLYTCTENKTFSTFLSVCNGIVLIVPAGLILAKLFGIDGVWMALTAAQYAALVLVFAVALLMKKRKNADTVYLLDRSLNTERMAFSVGPEGFSADAVKSAVTQCAGNAVAEAVSGILEIIAGAETLPRARKDTDVRITRDNGCSVLVKNSGAALTEAHFSALKEKYPALTVSGAVGFTQINLPGPIGQSGMRGEEAGTEALMEERRKNSGKEA